MLLDEWPVDEYVDVLEKSEFFIILDELVPRVSCVGHDVLIIHFKDDGQISKVFCLVERFATAECDVFAYIGNYFMEYIRERQQVTTSVVMRLRIVTSFTVPSASLQEYGCPQARSIND